jgi:hypothetical protein
MRKRYFFFKLSWQESEPKVWSFKCDKLPRALQVLANSMEKFCEIKGIPFPDKIEQVSTNLDSGQNS